jgi:vacuolar-type H+-ATPase subunit I/STV1
LFFAGEVEEEEKEREHSSLQEQLDQELQDLDKRLQQKEVLFSFDLIVHIRI